MAQRPVFISNKDKQELVEAKNIEFEWFPGFSVKQKQRSIQSLHESILEEYPTLKVLEVSSKADNELGIALSAFNLMIETKRNKSFSVETAFQASKVFEFGGPFVNTGLKFPKNAGLKFLTLTIQQLKAKGTPQPSFSLPCDMNRL